MLPVTAQETMVELDSTESFGDVKAVLQAVLTKFDDFSRGLEMVSAAVKVGENKMRAEIESVRSDLAALVMTRSRDEEFKGSAVQQLSTMRTDEQESRELLDDVTATAGAASPGRVVQVQCGLTPEIAASITEPAREELAKALPFLLDEARAEARQTAQASGNSLGGSCSDGDKGGASTRSLDAMTCTDFVCNRSEMAENVGFQSFAAQLEQAKERLCQVEAQNAQLQAEVAMIQADASARADKIDVELQGVAARSELQRLDRQLRDVAQVVAPLSQKVESAAREAQSNARENLSLGGRCDMFEAQLKAVERDCTSLVASVDRLQAGVTFCADRMRGAYHDVAAAKLSQQLAAPPDQQASGTLGQNQVVVTTPVAALPCGYSSTAWPAVRLSPAASVCTAATSDRLPVTAPARSRPQSPASIAGHRGVLLANEGQHKGALPQSSRCRSMSHTRQRSQSRGAATPSSPPADVRDNVERLVTKLDRMLSEQAMGMAASDLAAMAEATSVLAATGRTLQARVPSPSPLGGRTPRASLQGACTPRLAVMQVPSVREVSAGGHDIIPFRAVAADELTCSTKIVTRSPCRQRLSAGSVDSLAGDDHCLPTHLSFRSQSTRRSTWASDASPMSGVSRDGLEMHPSAKSLSYRFVGAP